MVEDKKFSNLNKFLEDVKSEEKYGVGIRHVQVVCMCSTVIALFISRSSLGIAILAMTDKNRRNDSNIEIYDWDKNTQGLILSSFFWGYTAMQVPAGILAKKYGGKLILLVALLANSALCLILPFIAKCGGWMLVCCCRVLMGLTQACLFPATHTLLGRWLPASERTALAGLVFGGAQIGTIIAMPVSGLLADTRLGWKLIFYSMSGLLFLTAACWYWFSASSPGEHKMISVEEKRYIEVELNSAGKRNLPTPWKEIFRCVPLWAILVVHVGGSFAFTLFFVDLPTYLERAMQISLKSSALLSSLPYIGMWVGGVLSTSICEKVLNKGLLSTVVSRKIFNSIGMFGLSIGCVILAFLSPEQRSIAVLVLFLTLTLYGVTTAGYMVNNLDLSPNFAGVMQSITNFAASLGSVITPVVTSLILRNDPTDFNRWRIVFLLVAAIAAGSNVIYVIFGKTDKQTWDSPDYFDRKIADLEEMKPALDEKQDKEDVASQQLNVTKG